MDDGNDELAAAYRAARETADRVERGEDVDPGDIGAAIENLRSIRSALSDAKAGGREHLVALRARPDEATGTSSSRSTSST